MARGSAQRWSVPASTRLGRYELLQPLGIGGMAEIFKARVSGPAGYERLMVIKRILPACAGDPEFVDMFVAEARLLGMLHHPNVVEVYDFGEAGGSLYLALEYVDGPSLSRVLRTLRAARRPMPVAVAAYVAREVARALDSVHNLRGPDGRLLGVVHRDVTPSNILLTTAGGVKLLDFGVAKTGASEAVTRAGTVKGKPAYLAPEQIEGRRIDGRVDVFALGVVLHEMLTLEHLFSGDSDIAIARQIVGMRIPRPSELRADVPPALDAIVMRALKRRRGRRYAGAAEMARELDDFVLASRLHLTELEEFVGLVQALAHHRLSRPELAAAASAPAAGDRTIRSWPRPAVWLDALLHPLRGLLHGPVRRGLVITGAVLALTALGLVFGWPALGHGTRPVLPGPVLPGPVLPGPETGATLPLGR